MLRVRDLHTYYGKVHVLKGVSLNVQQGEIVTLLGNNGAGKSTLLKTLSGLVRPTSGSIEFLGKRVDVLPSDEIVSMGMSHAPEGRRVFPRLSVLDNIRMGAYVRKDEKGIEQDIEMYLARFPIMEERKDQVAGTLSGGEQQVLAIVRALMSRPRLMLLDEPSLGLMPMLVSEIFRVISEIREAGMTILLVEQNARKALNIADRGYALETGEIVLEGSAEELRENDELRKRYLGEG
jgi:branched-chain amino acid transport system ATP-binding protein